MKKTKLLIAMAAASMVAIATGTVSTMAWYKIENEFAAKAGSITGNGNVTVTAPTQTATSSDYTIACSIVKATTQSKLVLSDYKADSDAYVSKYWDVSGTLRDYVLDTSEACVFEYDITFTGTWGAGTLTNAEKHKMLGDSTETYTLTMVIGGAAAGRARIAKAIEGGSDTDPNKFVDEVNSSSASSLTYTINVKDFVKSNTSSETNPYTGEGQTQTAKLYVRLDGVKNADSFAEANIDSGSLVVTVTGTAATSVNND